MNIVFMGTPEFAVAPLISIHEAGHKISLVVSQKDRPRGRGKKLQPTPVKEKALELGLEVFQPDNINSKESIDFIKQTKPDLIVVVAYGQILKEEVLSLARLENLNIHASLLPKYRGAAPINWAIINGEVKTGVSIMRVEKGLDKGPVLLRKEIPIEDEDTGESLHNKLMYLGAEAIVESLDLIEKGSYEFQDQDHEKSSYSPMLSKEDGLIDWSLSGREIKNKVRGLMPWPMAYSNYQDQVVKIHHVEVVNSSNKNKPGEIISVGPEGILVATGSDFILIKELQFPGKRRMLVEDYIKGNKIEVGYVLK